MAATVRVQWLRNTRIHIGALRHVPERELRPVVMPICGLHMDHVEMDTEGHHQHRHDRHTDDGMA
jgi:hypothetical protein